MEDQVADRVLDPHQHLATGAVEVLGSAKDLTGRVRKLGASDPAASADGGKSLRPGEAQELGVDVVPIVEGDVECDMIDEFCRAHETKVARTADSLTIKPHGHSDAPEQFHLLGLELHIGQHAGAPQFPEPAQLL